VKLLITAALIICASAIGQDATSELKHTVVPLNGTRWVSAAAVSVERTGDYPGVVSLKGKVEMKVPVCVPAGKDYGRTCDGEMVVRADEARVREDTGEIEANGHVVITQLQPKN
jgi:hypothetical protein